MKEIYLDVETGGFNPQDDALSSIAMRCDGKTKIWYIQPYGRNYNAQAIFVNGLTKEFLQANGKPLEIVFKEVLDYLRENTLTDKFGLNIKPKLIGQNLRFDIGFMEEFFKVFGISMFKYVDYHYLDTMFFAQMFNKLGYTDFKSFKLVELYKDIYGEDENTRNAHKADIDVLMCEKLMNFFMKFRKE